MVSDKISPKGLRDLGFKFSSGSGGCEVYRYKDHVFFTNTEIHKLNNTYVTSISEIKKIINGIR